jgi:hypothetical protein
VRQSESIDEMGQKHLGEAGLFRRVVHMQVDATSPTWPVKA